MRSVLLACVVLIGCGSWSTVAPAPRDGLPAEQAESYRALAHALSGFMNARAKDLEIDLNLAGVLEEVLLHARAVNDDDWNDGRTQLEQALGPVKIPQQTSVTVWLRSDAPWRDRWERGEQLSGVSVFDDLIRDDGMRIVKHGYGFFELIVPREVNGFALENRVAEVDGLLGSIPGWDLYAWGNSLAFGDRIAIRPDTRSGGWSLRISLGWGDCPSGCIYGRTYKFEIDTDGATRLISAQGNPLP